MAERAQEVHDGTLSVTLRGQWDQHRATIADEYAKEVTLDQFNASDRFGGVSRTSRIVSGGKLDKLLQNYKANKTIVEGFEAQKFTPEQLAKFEQYHKAKNKLPKLEKQWQKFKKSTIFEVNLRIDL